MIHWFLSLVIAALLVSAGAEAGTFNFIGYGAANQSMGNATVALPTDAFSQAYNPALMALQDQTEFSIGIEGAMTSFNSINQVLIDTPNLGASSNLVGNVSTATENTLLATLAYQTALYQGERPWHIGINVVAPMDKIFEVNTPDLFEPAYSLYMADTQRLVMGFAAAKSLSDDLSVGLGGIVYLIEGATSVTHLPSGGEATGQLAANIVAGVAPQAGLVYKLGAGWNAGLGYRGVQNYQNQIDIDTQLNVLGPTDLMFSNAASVDYDPDMFLLGLSHSDGVDTFALGGQLELWGPYNGGALRMNFQSYNGSFSQSVPNVNFQNIISLHGGFQHKFASSQVSVGYAYVPTPVPDQSGMLNILDSDKQEIYAGWGWRWHPSFWTGVLKLDLVAFADILMPKTVTKVSSQFIGSPGYSIGGTIFGYGLTATREF